MKNLSLPFAKLIAAAACALTLGSCSRAEYAMLPKGGSYHGVTRAATPVPVAPQNTAPVAAPAASEAVAITSEAKVAVPTAIAAPTSTQAPAAREVAVTPVVQAVTQPAKVAAITAPKLNALQRLTLNKVTRKMDKLVQKSGSARQHDNTASTSKTSAISGNLRTGLILLLVGLIVGIFSNLIGGIIALIGLVFIVLWLLDSL